MVNASRAQAPTRRECRLETLSAPGFSWRPGTPTDWMKLEKSDRRWPWRRNWISSGTRARALILSRALFDCQVLKPRRSLDERQLHDPCGPVALFGDDQLGFALQ